MGYEKLEPDDLRFAVRASAKIHRSSSKDGGVGWDISVTFDATDDDVKGAVDRAVRGYRLLEQAIEGNIRLDTSGGAKDPAAKNGDRPHCKDCGTPMEYRTGTAKSGKRYAGYFCPLSDHGPGHEPVWTSAAAGQKSGW